MVSLASVVTVWKCAVMHLFGLGNSVWKCNVAVGIFNRGAGSDGHHLLFSTIKRTACNFFFLGGQRTWGVFIFECGEFCVVFPNKYGCVSVIGGVPVQV